MLRFPQTLFAAFGLALLTPATVHAQNSAADAPPAEEEFLLDEEPATPVHRSHHLSCMGHPHIFSFATPTNEPNTCITTPSDCIRPTHEHVNNHDLCVPPSATGGER